MATENFGTYLRDLRAKRRLTLRAFCVAAGLDPANHSKIERGVSPAPRDEKLEPIRRALALDETSQEWRELLRLAAISRSEIPKAVLSDAELVGRLPVLFRVLEGDNSSPEALDELVAMMRRG